LTLVIFLDGLGPKDQFNITDQMLIRYSAFLRYGRRNGNTMGQCISYI